MSKSARCPMRRVSYGRMALALEDCCWSYPSTLRLPSGRPLTSHCLIASFLPWLLGLAAELGGPTLKTEPEACQLPNLGEQAHLQARKCRWRMPLLATHGRVFTWPQGGRGGGITEQSWGGPRKNRPSGRWGALGYLADEALLLLPVALL